MLSLALSLSLFHLCQYAFQWYILWVFILVDFFALYSEKLRGYLKTQEELLEGIGKIAGLE